MLSLFWNSKSSMNAQQNKLDTISNNIANVNTTGYRALQSNFSDLVYDSYNRLGTPNSGKDTELLIGTGTRLASTIRNDVQGSLLETKVSTEFALDGPGFFKITTADGTEAYTRNGSFKIDSNGDLCDDKGNYLSIEFNGQPVKFNPNNFAVNPDGTITVKEGEAARTVGRIPIFNAIGNDSFSSIADSLYVPKDGVQVYRENNTDILQGYLENSNVDMSKEMTDMIVTQRAFELSSKVLSTGDQMWGIVNNIRGR
ncbi:flagellar basal-body rod protein FlgG [Clostridium cellulovorans]|uniref:Fagellar hook-basal body protein n=1 Tax=Clostridium cellulovorans (strain ATCC 35296 / DSM 3052 / OCM 3 / 743B) TaxID=573061 RepID=D9SKI7_CLOC7|nr:flagellar basal-body rod protein FlgG [Clostridium cellulovorans]ADL51483.1 fagellar hook-basal body protein [Clostridium cellulovorans 743B]